jgi:high affinity sulfate transporter 1
MNALFASLRGYQGTWLRGDLIAGLTVWAVMIPEALAYATIAGVSPVIGLYAAPGALLLYAVFGSSRKLVVGPMAATAALSAAAVGGIVDPGDATFTALTIGLALCVGVIAVVAGLMRLGFLASFISEPVLKGFIIGLALTIIVGQLPKLFGVEKVEGNFFEALWGFLGNLGDTNLPTLAVGLISLVIVVALKELLPVVPGSLVAVFFGIGAVSLLGLADQGVDIVGEIDGGLPTLGLPSGIDLSDYLTLGAAAVGVALVGFAEGLGAAKTYAAKDHDDIDANREMLGLGAANLASGLSGGMVVNGSLSKTAVNAGAGAKSQVSGLVVAVLTIVTLLFLTGLFEQLPEATLAAVVIAALIELVDVRSLIGFYRLSTSRLSRIYGFAARPDFIAAVAATLGVLLFDTLPGLFIGIGVSLVLLVYRASRPHVATLGLIPGSTDQYGDVERHADNAPIAGIAILRPESGLYFANADRVRGAIRSAAAADGIHGIVLDLGTVPDMDLTAARMLVEARDELEADGRRLVIAHDIGQVRDVLRVSGESLDVYPTIGAAVTALGGPDEIPAASTPKAPG